MYLFMALLSYSAVNAYMVRIVVSILTGFHICYQIHRSTLEKMVITFAECMTTPNKNNVY